MALTALAIGVLGIIDLAGGPVTDSAYPAVALGLSGVMLVVGAFYGRAGGLIAFGLLAAMVTAGATAAHEVDAGKIEASPTLAADVDDTYELFAGKIDLDLSDVRDIENLDGRHIDVEAVVRPDRGDRARRVSTSRSTPPSRAARPGCSGRNESNSNTARHSARDLGAPVLSIDAELVLGEITVDTEERIDR